MIMETNVSLIVMVVKREDDKPKTESRPNSLKKKGGRLSAVTANKTESNNHHCVPYFEITK
jgi:hypothetical protein